MIENHNQYHDQTWFLQSVCDTFLFVFTHKKKSKKKTMITNHNHYHDQTWFLQSVCGTFLFGITDNFSKAISSSF